MHANNNGKNGESNLAQEYYISHGECFVGKIHPCDKGICNVISRIIEGCFHFRHKLVSKLCQIVFQL